MLSKHWLVESLRWKIYIARETSAHTSVKAVSFDTFAGQVENENIQNIDEDNGVPEYDAKEASNISSSIQAITWVIVQFKEVNCVDEVAQERNNIQQRCYAKSFEASFGIDTESS